MASPSSTRADSIQLASLELPGCLHLPLPSLAGGPFNSLPISPNKWWTSWWISWWSSCIFDQWPPTFWPDFALGERKDLMALLLLFLGSFVPFQLDKPLSLRWLLCPSSVLAMASEIAFGLKGIALLSSNATGTGGWTNGSGANRFYEILLWRCRFVLG